MLMGVTMIKINPELKKIVWGLGLTFGVVIIWYFLAFTNYGLVAAGFNLLGFNDHVCGLHDEFMHAVSTHDIPKAQETLKRFDEWESGFNLRREQEYQKERKKWEAECGVPYPNPMPRSFAGVYYHEIFCEMNKDWDGAFHYLDEYSKISFDNYAIRGYFIDCDVDAIRARLYYKMGKKSLAFAEYCDLTNSMNPEQDAESVKSRYSLCQRQKFHCLSDSMSCFPTYSSFLQFMEEEYEALGKPEEYKDAMDIYRSLDAEDSSLSVVVALED